MKRRILVLMLSVLYIMLYGTLCVSANLYGDLTYFVQDGKITITACDTFAQEVNIPDKISGKPVVTIAEKAFYQCERLEKVTIPSSVKSIGDSAFEYCTSLKSATIEYGITEIPYRAFSGCNSLESLILPDSLIYIGEDAFIHCESLSGIKIPESVTTIGINAFKNCYELQSIVIPEKVTKIYQNVFRGCDSLTSITVDEDNGYYSSDDGVLFNKDKTKLISFPCGKGRNYTISETVTQMEQLAFEKCKKLKSVTFAGNIDYTGTFINCTALEKVTFSGKVKSISSMTFKYCTSLKEINLPEGLEKIGSSAFEACESLKSINLPENLTEISETAFKDCKSLESITIPESIDRIEREVFSGCSSLKKVSLPEDLSVIGSYSFEDCTSLENIVIPYYANIHSYAFENCTSLKNVFYMLYDPARVSYYDFGSNVKRYYGYWPAKGIEINAEKMDLLVGQTSKLVATITPQTATQDVVWRSDNPSVATVTAEGLVEAVATGTAKIIASTLAEEQVAECPVSVSWGEYPALIAYNEETGKLTASLTETGTLYVATYSGGVFEKVEKYDVSVGITKGICSFAANQKAFVWDKDLKPLCKIFTINE